jgi:hypothetical protein
MGIYWKAISGIRSRGPWEASLLDAFEANVKMSLEARSCKTIICDVASRCLFNMV